MYTAALFVNKEDNTYTDTARKTHGARLGYVVDTCNEKGFEYFPLAEVATKEEAKTIIRNARTMMDELGYTRVTRSA